MINEFVKSYVVVVGVKVEGLLFYVFYVMVVINVLENEVDIVFV